MMHEIVLDTETTGLDPAAGHRIVEIGAVELLNRLPTGRTFHVYVNPERDMPREAEAVHGLSSAFLNEKPVFSEIAQEFINFIADATLVIHNASFDMAFINAELAFLGLPAIQPDRVVDTLHVARQNTPGHPPVSMPCAAATESTTAREPSMEHYSTPNYLRKSILN